MSSSRPLISFILIAYNQERFLYEAVQGALAQTYSPLEIVLSDDCSCDRTFEIMRGMAAQYMGPHPIILNRNSATLGIGDHINAGMRLSSGELVVIAAGDDISLPERTKIIYEAWQQCDGSATSIYSDYSLIDEDGNTANGTNLSELKTGPLFQRKSGDIHTFLSTMTPLVNGCSHAWSRDLFRLFGDLPCNLMQEDLVLTFRSLAVGKIIFVNRPLIRYRRHGDNLSFHSKDMACTSYSAQVAKRQIALKRHINAYDAILEDIRTLEGMHKYDSAYSMELGQEATRVKRLCELELRFLTEGFGARLITMMEIVKRSGMRLFTRLLPQLLPKYIYHRLRNFRQFVRSR